MAYPNKPSPLVRAGQVLLALICSGGLLAGGFFMAGSVYIPRG